MLTDIRIACRTLIKTPTFTLTAIVVLALGIGANSAVFGLVNQVPLSPPGVAQPDRVVALRAKYDKLHLASIALSGPDFGDAQRATDVFEHVAVTEPRDLNYTGGAVPEGLRGAAVSREWFEVFGIPPALGHAFTAEDDQMNAAPAVAPDLAAPVRRRRGGRRAHGPVRSEAVQGPRRDAG